VSAFSQLLDEAGKLGIGELTFRVNPIDYREDDGRERWECVGFRAPWTITKRGRTGEEALRRVVEEFGGVAT
jgi:hypothetical protein